MIVRCGACRALLNEPSNASLAERKGCPTCGAMSRHFEANLSVEMRVRAKLGFKHKNTNNKVVIEGVSGDDLFRKKNLWVHLERFLDHKNDLYHEKITDSETGDIIHQSDEPLSQHLGHGDDRRR